MLLEYGPKFTLVFACLFLGLYKLAWLF